MGFEALPATAAWHHRYARDGFEVVFLRPRGEGYALQGHTSAVEAGEAWAVRYSITVDQRWRTRRAHVVGRSRDGNHEVLLEHDGSGEWLVGDVPVPRLSGCLDIDLESSALTNAIPVHRLALREGEQADSPAAYVRALDLAVERLEQSYLRVEDDGEHQRFDYAAPVFDFGCRLVYDRHGLVLEYPGLAVRRH
jgi:hypothetical protein